MNYAEIGQLDLPREESLLRVFSLNTGLSGRQVFTEPAPGQSLSWRFDRILDFIYQEAPDVVLLQEVYENDLQRYRNALGGQMVFSRFCNLSLTDREEEAESWGVAIGSRLNLFNVTEHYFDATPISPEKIVLNNESEHAHSLLQASLSIGSERFNFATAYFTWHNKHEPSEQQLKDFAKLDDILTDLSDIVLTGDFNSPRGYYIFDSLAKRYRDNIPPEAISTNDFSIRPDAWYRLVIDGFFTSEHYQASGVRFVNGLSDHQGIMAGVGRVSLQG